MPTFKNELRSGIGTTEQNLLTCSVVAGTTLIGLTCANTTANTISVSVKITSGATTAWVTRNTVILPGASLVVLGGSHKIVLEQNDSISVVSSAAASCDAILSYLNL
jgi:hypothetical protein